ncbi:MAG: tRNA (adenosine(37)-N6)-threonylcarbamoyltransferase complex transferase subunit TsaD [Verrucomicrobiia bacterium Tous-C2TDCM]|nr:MAG: tRNA (adenosine(37)-N6)-threonylcarbamoyltransferase complex transferase subunit TsaD [Verrucomicrobiae bacterium Tous-C2TDCM]
MSAELVLAIETSCDETAVAVADGLGRPLVNRIASQIKLHAPYGGVVPELASRNHSLDLRPLLDSALSGAGLTPREIGLVAATSGPGLASSLLVGDTLAKAVAVGLGCPFYSINHMEGHLLSPFLHPHRQIDPHVALIVSGGHTLLIKVVAVGDYRLLGSTKDDAAGEAFDKVGKLLGLPYPGGPEIAKLATEGRRDAHAFPRSMVTSGDLNFSFSGLKTSARVLIDRLGAVPRGEELADFCGSFEEAIVDILVFKLIEACRRTGLRLAAISGGVSCNQRLRERLTAATEKAGIELILADPAFSTDNAAMIAFAAASRRLAGYPPSPLDGDINPNLRLA